MSMLPFSDFAVRGLEEAQQLLRSKPNYWNVVSLWSERWTWGEEQDGTYLDYGKWTDEAPDLTGAKSVCSHYFHDDTFKADDDDKTVLCEKYHIEDILAYARKHWHEPLLVHCHAGMGRSPAIAMLIVMDAIKDKTEFPYDDALEIVYYHRPIMTPNKHILAIGVPLVLGKELEPVKSVLMDEKFWQDVAKDY